MWIFFNSRFLLLETSIVVDFGGGRVQTVHAGILSSPATPQPQPPDPLGQLNQRFIRAAALGDIAAVESILGGGAGIRVDQHPEMVSLPDRFVIR